MVYDKESRMVVHNLNGTLTTSTYSADGLKRAEITSAGNTTLVGDGTHSSWPYTGLESARLAHWRFKNPAKTL